MNTFQKSLAISVAFAAGVLASTTASATPFIITLTQQGSNVVATGSGALDVTGLPSPSGTTASPGIVPNSFILIGSSSGGFLSYTAMIAGPTDFGPGSSESFPNASTGDAVGIGFSFNSIAVPTGYISDTSLSGTATWNNATFASLGVTPGTYTWTWGEGTDQSFTLEIGAFSVPEPSALALFGGGLLLLGAFVGSRRRQAA